MKVSIKKIGWAMTVWLGASLPTHAADFELRPTIGEADATANWSGFYAGLHAGSVMSQGGVELADSFGFLIPLDISNGLFFREQSDLQSAFGAGMTAGYNQQYGGFVFGVEGDITFTSLDANHHLERIDPNPIFPFFGQNVISDYKTNFEDLYTLRLRAGKTFGNTLLYATGGLAAADVTNSFSIAIPGIGYQSPADWRHSGTAWGYAVGGGVEHKLSESISVKAEGIYMDLEDVTVVGSDPINFPGEGISYKFENELAVARVGVNVHF